MTAAAPKVVFDCNIFVQALINLNGAAGRCMQKARNREERAKGSEVRIQFRRRLLTAFPWPRPSVLLPVTATDDYYAAQ